MTVDETQIKNEWRFCCRVTTPSGNRTRVSPVAGAYSITRPTVSEAVIPPQLRCCNWQLQHPYTQSRYTTLIQQVDSDSHHHDSHGATLPDENVAPVRARHDESQSPRLSGPATQPQTSPSPAWPWLRQAAWWLDLWLDVTVYLCIYT